MLNLSPLTPEARPIVEAAAAIYLRHLQPNALFLIGDNKRGGVGGGAS